MYDGWQESLQVLSLMATQYLLSYDCGHGARTNNAGRGVYALKWTDSEICKLELLSTISSL